jgi:hypothetical protein
LGIDRSGESPAVLARVICAGTMLSSYETASAALAMLAEVSVSAKQVERRTLGIGTERCAERDAAADAYLALPLVERKAAPAGVVAPDLAVVMMDGGRLQIFDRSKGADGSAPPSDTPMSPERKGKYWREDKVGLLVSMASACGGADPCPTLPAHYLDAGRIGQLVREIKANAEADGCGAAAGDNALPPGDTALSAADRGMSPAEYEPPEPVLRSVVATKRKAGRFGELLAAAAWERGFYGSPRRAFLGDGSNANWGVWERHFSSFTPIVDFIHALAYVYQGAMAGRPFADGWPDYAAWIAALWSGDVAAAIAGLAARQAALGEPEESDGEASPRTKLAEALGYLRNQRGRMGYDEYRRAGLPITTSHVESTIKRLNQRVKGTEKFWSEPGAEAILQLRADTLSETDPLEKFWVRRASQATGERRQRSRCDTNSLAV